MPQMVLDVTPELQERVDFWCGETQQSPNILMLHALEDYLDDLEDEEDYEDAVRISEAVARGEEEVYTSEQVRDYLGLER